MDNGQYLTRQLFGTQLDKILQEAGVNAKLYNTHSFRIEAGISDVNIQMLGCWKSDAYKLYIRTPAPHLARVSSRLAGHPPR